MKPQSSSSIDKRKLVLYLAILVAIAGGFYWSHTTTDQLAGKQTERSIDVNEFLKLQCQRDDFRDQVIIGALQDAKRRAQRSLKDPFERAFEVGKIQYSIDEIKAKRGECLRTLPVVES